MENIFREFNVNFSGEDLPNGNSSYFLEGDMILTFNPTSEQSILIIGNGEYVEKVRKEFSNIHELTDEIISQHIKYCKENDIQYELD